MKIFTIIGARPQFIKAAPVSKAIINAGHTEYLVHTGQHYDHRMSQIFFDELEIPKPAVNLGVGSSSHGKQTGKMLAKLEALLQTQYPDWVIIYGDTNSTLAGALAAVKLHIPIAHVEAGLRSFNREMPEEINRVLSDHCAELLFCPTKTAVDNLRREGIPENKIHQVGDVMFDATLLFGENAKHHSKILIEHNLVPHNYVLATAHRAENTNNFKRLNNIVDGLAKIARELPVIWPIHPRTKKALRENNLLTVVKKDIKLIPPAGYLDMLMLEMNARLIITDSGGVQKEAFFYKVPCITLRDETEWTETVELGWNQLVSPSKPFGRLKITDYPRASFGEDLSPYGDGNASKKILAVLENGS